MTEYEIITLLVSVLALLMIPTIGLLLRIVVKWTQTEARLGELTKDMSELIRDKDRTHQEMLGQMREDRNATNKRLRWLEENVWNKRVGG